MRILLLLTVVLLWCSATAFGQPLRVVTEEWPPYSYTENGKIVGVVTEIVRETLDRSGLDYTIESYPFARAYNTAISEENVLIYSILRMPYREPHFRWIKLKGLSIDMYLFRPSFRNDIEVTKLEEARKYRVGVTRETSTHHYLKANGFVEEKNLFPVNCEEFNTLKSQPDAMRIDLTTGDQLSLTHWLKKSSLPSDYWVKQMKLFSEPLYMAVGTKTSSEVVTQIQKAFDEVRAEGLLEATIDKYNKLFQ